MCRHIAITMLVTYFGIKEGMKTLFILIRLFYKLIFLHLADSYIQLQIINRNKMIATTDLLKYIITKALKHINMNASKLLFIKFYQKFDSNKNLWAVLLFLMLLSILQPYLKSQNKYHIVKNMAKVLCFINLVTNAVIS